MDVICIGESMTVLAPEPPQPLRDDPVLRLHPAGAEGNVATYLAMLGARVAWRGRLGVDPFAGIITDQYAAAGVDISLVETDPDAPTGVYFKDPSPRGTTVYYYRAGSAAARMGPDFAAGLPPTRVAHLSGITPALSASCAGLVRHVLVDRPLPGAVVSFDVNYRAPLWPAERAAPVLADLANAADVVFVGRDEAETLWGTATPAEIRAVLPDADTLVIKDGEHGATAYTRDGEPVFVPAPPVEVVEPVGAGDAFAAGYLFGLLEDAGQRARLRLGHLIAGCALRVTGDIGRLPPRDQIIKALSEGTP